MACGPGQPILLTMHLKAHRWAVIVAYAIANDEAEAGASLESVDLSTVPRSETSIMCYDCGVPAPPADLHCPEAPRAGYPT